MIIGILTQPLRNNYGGLLQNYALQLVLKRLGHEPITIDWDGRFTLKEKLWRLRVQIMHVLGIGSEIKLRYIPNKKEELIISGNTNNFISEYIKHTPTAYSLASLHENALKIQAQAFVVGSDQVWRPGYNAFPYAMFLDFTKNLNVHRVAYAASFGSDNWGFNEEDTKLLRSLAGLFNIVTVREKTGVELCKHFLGVDAIHVLDPTMLLNREDYENIVQDQREPKSEGTLFHYILDPSEEKTKLINLVARNNGLIPFTIMPKCQAENRTKDDIKKHINDCVFPSVTRWLRGFIDAEMVIVDSFHGAVFSIIFNKPFWVIGNKGRGNTRFDSLLSLYNLKERFIDDPKTADFDFKAPIDWDAVNSIRDKEINKSLGLLIEGLK
jgi:hypothetical protein